MRGGSARSLFREQAGQDVRRRASACFVAREIAADQIAGFYTLALLWDAIERAGRSEVAVYAFVVDAKDEQAEAFYLHHGFVAFGGATRFLILPLPEKP